MTSPNSYNGSQIAQVPLKAKQLSFRATKYNAVTRISFAVALSYAPEQVGYDTLKAYFYCRVAHDDSFSLERQAEELRRYAEQAGYTIVGAAAEHGSGMTLDRPALQKVMESVLAGKVDVVLISSLDRIGRDWGMTKQYIDLLTEHKVKLLCLRERVSIDSSNFSPFST